MDLHSHSQPVTPEIIAGSIIPPHHNIYRSGTIEEWSNKKFYQNNTIYYENEFFFTLNPFIENEYK